MRHCYVEMDSALHACILTVTQAAFSASFLRPVVTTGHHLKGPSREFHFRRTQTMLKTFPTWKFSMPSRNRGVYIQSCDNYTRTPVCIIKAPWNRGISILYCFIVYSMIRGFTHSWYLYDTTVWCACTDVFSRDAFYSALQEWELHHNMPDWNFQSVLRDRIRCSSTISCLWSISCSYHTCYVVNLP